MFLSGEWGSHFFCLEGAIKVTALDECPLAVSLSSSRCYLTYRGPGAVPPVGDITSSHPFPLVSLGLVIFMALILLGSYRHVHCVNYPVYSEYMSRRPPSVCFPPQGCQLNQCASKAWRSALGVSLNNGWLLAFCTLPMTNTDILSPISTLKISEI